MILKGDLAKRVREVLVEIAERYEFEIDTMEVKEDHVHLFLTAPPRYSPAGVVQIIKSISAKVVFKEFPEVKEQLWGGEFWSWVFCSVCWGQGNLRRHTSIHKVSAPRAVEF